MSNIDQELEGKKVIGQNEFKGREDIVYLRIPDGVKRIGAGAFADCMNLKEVFIPDTVEVIGENAFTHFEVITCEHFLRPEGWLFVEEDGEIPKTDDLDILDQVIESKVGRSWCGSYSYQLTFDEFIVEGKQYLYYPQRKVLWGREWNQFLVNEKGEWFFDVFTYLEWLGEDLIKKGMIFNFNPIAKEILDGLKETMGNEYASDDSIIEKIQLYHKVVLDPLMSFEHGLEYVFGQWALYHLIWLLSQMENMPDKRKNWTKPAMIEKEEYSKMLYDMGGERWKKLESLIVTGGRTIETSKTISLEDMNQNIIEGIGNSLNDGSDAALEYVQTFYNNDGGNDFFLQSRAELEKALFRLFIYKLFIKESNINLKSLVLDDEYYKNVRQSVFTRLAVDVDEALKIHEKGKQFLKEGRFQEACDTFKRAILKGNVKSMFCYADLIIDHPIGERILDEVDVKLEGAFWYWLSATMGNAEAMNNMALCYNKGHGVKKNKNLMLYWMAKSASLMYPQAIYNMSIALQKERAFTGEEVKAIAQIFRRAADEVQYNDSAQNFVRNNAEIIIECLNEQSLLYNTF